MTEPPRPPGEDPSSPPPPSYPPPGEASGGYAPPPSGAYGSPPGGGYPPGYSPGGVPAGYSSSDDKTWALVAHFGGAAGMLISGGWLGWVAPLIALLAQGNKSQVARAHATAALNFQLLWSIIGAIGFVLGICGSLIIIGAVFFVVPFITWLVGTIFGIVAGVKANEGQLYRYPMSVNMVK